MGTWPHALKIHNKVNPDTDMHFLSVSLSKAHIKGVYGFDDVIFPWSSKQQPHRSGVQDFRPVSTMRSLVPDHDLHLQNQTELLHASNAKWS